MRIYQNALEMIKEVERDLAEMGVRYQSYSVQDKIVKDDHDYETMELSGYAYKLVASEAGFDLLDSMLRYKKDEEFVTWAKAEADERLYPPVGRNPGKAWRKRGEFWKPFMRNGYFSYTYVERWNEQIGYILKELCDRPTTRQAIMTMYDRHQDMMNWGGLDRVPCSLTYQFLIRGDALHCIYSMRSCDFVNFFQADVYCTAQLQYWLCEQLDLRIGTFTHFIGSLHAFRKDLEGVF